MGHPFEIVADSSISSRGKDEMKERPTYSNDRTEVHDDRRENEILQFVKLLENSGSSEAMKRLLLKIINLNKCEELKPFLGDCSTDVNKVKKKLGRSSQDSSSYHGRSKNQTVRRSSKTGRFESSEQGTGSGQNSKSGTRKSTRTKIVDQGGKSNVIGDLAKTNKGPLSPGTSLRRSRQSDSCLRKGLRETALNSEKLATSSSLLQLRTARRSDLNRRRPIIHLNQGEMQVRKQNASWDPVPGSTAIGKRRTSTGSFLKSVPVSPTNQNAIWNSPVSRAKGSVGIDRLRNNTLGKIIEKRTDLGDNENKNVDYSGDSEDVPTTDDVPTTNVNGSKLYNSFAQFEPTGQVAYREQTVRLHDLVDDLRSNRELNSISNISNEDASEEIVPEKKGLRKLFTRPLTKKKVILEATNENYRSLSGENKFHTDDLNDSIVSSSFQSSIAS